MCSGHQLIASQFQTHPSLPVCDTRRVLSPLPVGLMLGLVSGGCWKDTEGRKSFSSSTWLCSSLLAPTVICSTGHPMGSLHWHPRGQYPSRWLLNALFSMAPSRGWLPFTKEQSPYSTTARSPPSSRAWLQGPH